MARSFGIVRAGTPLPGIKEFRHTASDQIFSVYRTNAPYMRRYQIGFDGALTNDLAVSIDYWIGSGRHAQGYVHRTNAGSLVELPLTWYPEDGGRWDMSPSYDRPDHSGFSRKLTDQCLFCHAAYPSRRPAEGIDCQRCHGPGGGHVNAARAGAGPEAIRKAIVNPARLNPARRLEVCMQCHLETTSRKLPAMLLRHDRDVFSYKPGEPLSAYAMHFDHAPGSGYDDKFELVSSAYRLRKSACFIKSGGALTCTLCHDPHGGPRDYAAACKNCHAPALEKLKTAGRHTPARDCASCHMPKRRPTDAGHIHITDHWIRKTPSANSLPPSDPYRGEVLLYYPPSLPPSPDNELYLAIAQLKQQSNLRQGLLRLNQILDQHPPTDGYFYFELAEAYRQSGEIGKAVAEYRRACLRSPDRWQYLEGLGVALALIGDLPGSEQALLQALRLAPNEPALHLSLARTYLRQARPEAAIATLKAALKIDPEWAEGHNTLGAALLQSGGLEQGERELREAVRLRPEHAAIRVNLAELLARLGSFAEAAGNFKAAIRTDPSSAPAHSAFGTALAAHGSLSEAKAELLAALNLNPALAVTHNNLGVVLLQLSDAEGAEKQFRLAIQAAPEYAEAHLELGRLLYARGDKAAAASHLRKAAESPDARIKAQANQILKALP